MKNEFLPTEEQQKILDLKEGIHLVLAPPGCGKTEILAQRVYNAKENGYYDSDVICLTFTNRAAKGMRERVERKYPSNEILIGNIHHFCSKFLYKNKLIPLNSSVLDEEEVDQLINELKDQFNYPPKDQKVYNPDLLKLATYLKQKELRFSDDLFLKPKGSSIPDPWHAKELCEEYNKLKQENKYLDFDDLLTLTYYHLIDLDKTKLILSQFKWIQVDEVQDLNPLQWAIINEITAPNSLVTYFGDYEQAIFSFMGAKLDSLHRIEQICKNNPKNSILNLCKNFRSPSYLLDVYIDYAETHWTPTWKQRPFSYSSKKATEKCLRIFEIEGTIINEARIISESILPELLVNNDKTAVIVRYNNSANVISKALDSKGIPHFKISGFDFFRRKFVKGLMAFFSVFQNEFDRLSWARVYYEFDVIKTLKESRTFVNYLFTIGITPIDILKYKGKSSRLNEFFYAFSNQEIVVFDTETTGLDKENDDIIQIAAVKITNGKIKDTFEVYINTDKDITESEKVHHISKSYLNNNGVSHQNGMTDFLQFIGENAILVAHNIDFDYSILKQNLQRYCKKDLSDYCKQQFDTIIISKLIYPNFASYKLKNLINFLNIEGINSHNALDDVKATVSLIEKLKFDFYNGLKQNQDEYLKNLQNTLMFNAFIAKFNRLYSLIQNQLDHNTSLIKVIQYYFDYYKSIFAPKDEENKKEWLSKWDVEMNELDKLIKHIDFYTKEDTLSLQKRIEKYIPEYRMLKESDLYLGNENVVVSTVYKAKGLEFDNVIVSESTDDTYPALWALKDASPKETEDFILEGARVFYVAMTRSKKKLYITYHTKSIWGHSKCKSRFVECISSYFE